MKHTHIIRASDLERYADTRNSQAVIPELIYLLVSQSNPSWCRIPYGDSVNQPGWDGRVQTEKGFLGIRSQKAIPIGRSVHRIKGPASIRQLQVFEQRKHICL